MRDELAQLVQLVVTTQLRDPTVSPGGRDGPLRYLEQSGAVD